ncbi:MAG: 3-dehydroquinate synthase [Micropruina sp.]|uniref:3-dehydroquinate synthase n=1 Tax=Micropruina sp. TaxID=2737536 RepID=UPI0039E3B869
MKVSAIDVTAERPYQVVVGTGALELLPQYVAEQRRIAVIHPPVLREQASRVRTACDCQTLSIEVPAGEEAKTGETLQRCWNALAEAGFTRSDAIVGLGGGATTDLAGFVASTWLRGVTYVSVPTTVLGMVDAAVGGKTGINLSAGKNLVGTFYEPYTVLCDLSFLESLPVEEIRSGMAEVVKAGFIADPAILSIVEDDPAAALDPRGEVICTLVKRAIAVKAAVVGDDLRERTSVGRDIGREQLNYGHTLGHAIERDQDYRWRHGEAISVGMAFVAELSRRLGLLDDDTAARHGMVLRALGLPTSYPAESWPRLRETMNLDKKTRASTLRFVVLEELGRTAILENPDEDLLQASFEALSADAGSVTGGSEGRSETGESGTLG